MSTATRREKKPDIEHPGVEGMWAAHRPSYSAYCQHCEASRERTRRISALYLGLKAFGYTTLTIEEIGAAYDLALEREPTAEDGIIPMFVRRQLREAGLVVESR